MRLYGLSEVFRVAEPVTVPAPSGLTAAPNGAMRIDLDWDDPPSGSSITGYKIERRDDASGSSWSDLVADTDSTDTEYSDTGLRAGATYRYRVSAHSSFGTSSASAIVRATTQEPPGAPTGLTATANGSMRIDLSWSAPASDGGTAVTGYRIEHTLDGGSNWSDLVADTDSTGTSYSDTGLPAGATRYYRVSAINAAGASDASNVARASANLAEFEIPYDWGLIPSGLGPGDSFRLLFVSADRRTAAPGGIVFYNAFVQKAAASGHADIQEYSSGFRAVGSTEDDDARDNTATTYTAADKGIPIHWLGGSKVADDYEDFYDGDWDDEVNATNESGTSRPFNSSTQANRPFTGSDHDGTGNNGNELGESSVRVGRPNDSSSSRGPINGGSNTAGDLNRPFYGLSAVLRVDPTLRLTDVAVISNPAISDTYGLGETIEIAVTFTDEAVAAAGTDFVISVGGKRRAGLLRGSGTKTLVFGYTVQAGDTDGNGIWIGDQDRTLVGNRDGEPQNGAITSSATGDAAVLTHAALLTLSGHKVDGTQQAPQVTIAAAETEFFLEMEDVIFTLTRTDSTAVMTVAVELTQDLEFLLPGELSQTVTFQPGESTAALVLDPRLFPAQGVTRNGTLTATVQSGTGYVPGTPDTASARIREVVDGVTVRLEEGSYTFAEDATGAASTVVLVATTGIDIPPPKRDVHISVSIQSDQARSGYDVQTLSLQQPLQPSDYRADGSVFSARLEVPLVLIDDALDEPDETFTVLLQKSPGSPGFVTLSQHDGTACSLETPCTATATITDNDPLPSLSVDDASAPEGQPVEFTARLSAVSGRDVTVGWQAATLDEGGDNAQEGTDYTTDSGTLTFTAGETKKTVAVSTTPDTVDDVGETFTLTLSNASNAEISDAAAKGTITGPPASTALVSNVGQGTDDQTIGTTIAQRFTIESDAASSMYTLTGVDVVSGGTNAFTAKVCGVDSSGYPTSTCTALTHSGTFAAGTMPFAAPANTSLEKGTTYTVVVAPATSGGFVSFGYTENDAEDEGKATGWSIGDGYDFINSGTDAWDSHSSRSVRVAIHGYASGAPANTAPAFPAKFGAFAFSENTAADTVVRTVTAKDDDDDALTYSLSEDETAGADHRSFAIDPSLGEIKTVTTATYDFETKPFYNVTAKVEDGNGGSDIIHFTVSLNDVPEQPATPAKPRLAAVAGSASSLVAAWTAPDRNGGPEIAGYDLQYREGTTGMWTDFAHSGTTVTRTITGLKTDTAYQVQVRAKNGELDSEWSVPSDAVTTNAVPPDDCPNDTTTACAVDVGSSATGTIETEDDLDWFKVELEAGTRYQIDMEGLPTSRGTMSDPNLVVRSAAFAVLATDDDGGVGANSRVIYTPTAAGTHYLEARAVNDDTGTYTLSVIVLGANGASEADTDFPEEPPTSGRVEVGASVTGNVAGDSDQDQFVVDLVAGKKYQFDLEGAPTGRGTLEDPYLSISGVSSNFDFIADNDNINATNKNSQLVYTATETGTYYLGAGASDSTLTGTYTLSVREVDTATDTTAPEVSSATVSEDGTSIDIIFDEDLDASGTAPAVSAFEVTVGGGTAVNPTSVAFHTSDADTVVLAMSPAIAAGAAVTVAYDKPISNALADAATNEVADFTAETAINRPAAPTELELEAGERQIEASWTAPSLNGGSAITGYRVEWKTAAQTWAEAATAGQSTTVAADATGHEITSLTNNTEYTVRVRAGNDAGDGPWSTEASETPVSAITQVTVEFGAASYTATEGGTAATVTVNLSADPERSVTIPITATGNGGAETSDYSLSANSVTIAGGSTSATFTVTATDDSVDDDGESVNLSFGTNLPDGVSEGTQRTATVSLTDNDGAMPVAVTVEFGAASYTAIEGQGAVTITVTLSADPERTVTIPITVPENGGADTSDYSLSANPVTINSGDTSATFTVTATDDDIYDGEGNDETLTLGFGTLPGGVETGTQNETEVSLLDNDIEWGSDLLPDDAEIGDEFRLLFVTSGEVYPTSSDIDVYNQFVQDAAAGGHADIQDYSSLFRALASTASVSALDNTATKYTSSNLGVPIWWLNGANVADDYRDFYDDSWDQGDPGSNETGSEVDFSPSGTCTNSALVWTGSNSDGEAQNNALGTSTPVAGLPCQTGGEIESGFVSDIFDYPLYGLSYVLQAARPDGPYVTDVGVHFEPEDSADDNGAYITGDTIRVAVTYSEDVVVGGTGTPTFPLQIGSTTVQAAYDAEKSTADQLVFTHLVVAGEVDDNGISSGGNLLTLPSTASITAADDDTEDAYLGPLNLSTELDVNSAPRILDVEVTSTPQAASDTYGLGEDIEITVTFSQAVHLEGDVLFRFNTGNGQRQARLARGNDTKALVFAYTVKSGDEDDNGIFIAHPNHNNHPTLQLETDVPGQDDQTIVGVATGLDAEIEHASPPSSSLGNHKIDATETGADATLSALSLSGITLDPVFSADTATTSFITTSFTATTSLSSITVTATASQSGARADIDPDDADTNTAGHQVALAEGDTVISVTVTSTNGDSTRTYTVTVTRGAATDTPSTDATLSALSVTGVTLDPAFASDTYAYTASVANDVEEVTFATTENHASATVRYLKGTDELTDEDGTEDDFQVDLDVGANAITVEVTAEDGSTTQDYAVTVTRACALETGDIWCGVVNVGDITNAQGDTQRHGFQGTTGGLSDETFSLMFETGTTNNYTITAIVVGATTATSEQLFFVTASGLTNTEVESLALHVDGESDPFVWSDSTEVITGSYRWPARTDLDWSSETTVTLRLREFPRPTVTNVEVTSTPVLETDTYGAGETIEVSVTFSEAVDATPDTDFVLSVAGVRRAPLLRGSGTATLVFGYTVVSSDDDDNGIWIGNETRTLDGNRNGEPQAGTITSVATGAAANLDHSELGTDSDHKVDGSRTTANVAPSFSSSATISVAENQTTVVTVVATDSDADDSVTGYAITGGADMALFEIGATSGELTFKSTPNFEDPQDSGTDNVHEVTVQATSGTDTRVKTATQTITVTVTNVDEGQSGTVTIDDTAPMVGDELTASTANAADPDGLPDPFAPTWKWYRTPDGGSETEITGETSATYTVVAADLGATLTAKASWTDNGGFANTLSSVPTGAVAAASTLPTLSVADAEGNEGLNIFFLVTLSATASQNATVTCTASFETGDTAAAADLSTTTGTATINAGATTGTCAIATVQDTIDEDNETFTVTLSNTSSNAQLATDPTAKGTIIDDDTAPTVTGVAITSTPVLETDTYGAGETIRVTVTFSEAVTVTGDPEFAFSLDSGEDRAPYKSGSGTTALVFAYTVAPSDEDDDGIFLLDGSDFNNRVGPVTLDSDDAIKSTGSTTDADLAHTGRGTESGHKVDGSRSIVSVEVTSTPQLESDTYGAGETILFTVTFTAKVDVTGDPVLEFLFDGSEVRQASDVSGGGTTELVFSYTVVSGDDDDNGLFLRDESDYNNPDGPVRLDSDDEIEFHGTSTDAPLYWAGRGTQSGHKVDGSRTTGNVAPSFTSLATFDAAENQSAVGTVVATDSDADDSVTGYAITGGADQTFFSIGATSGALTFDAAPNYEDAEDQGNNNTYVVDVTATSGTGTQVKTATQTITVTVTDVDTEAPGKPGAPTVSSASATSLSVNWSAPTNTGPAITDYDYRYRTTSPQGTWKEVTGTTIMTLSATIGSLSENTSYDVQVRATNDEGTGAWSDAGSGSTDANASPSFEVSGTYLGTMYLETLTRMATPSDSDTYVRGNRSVNGLWSDGATLWVADGLSNQARFRKLGCPSNAAQSSGDCGVTMGPSVPTGSQLSEAGEKVHHNAVQALTAYDLDDGYRLPELDLPNTSYLVYDDIGISTGCSEDDRTDQSGGDPGGGGACDGLVSPEGVWSDGDVVWVSDVSRMVKAYELTSFTQKSGTEHTVTLLPDRSLTMPVRSVPRGIWSDGTTIWVADACHRNQDGECRGRLVAFDLDDGDRRQDLDITGLSGYPDGVWSDGDTLWVSTTINPDSSGSLEPDQVLAYEFDPEGGEAVRDSARDLRLRRHRNATGLWSDGERIWVADGGSAVHVYCLDRDASCHDAPKRSTDATTALIYDTGDDEVTDSFALDTENDNPLGTWSNATWADDGTLSDDAKLYVVDGTDDKVYPYDLKTGDADTGLDLAPGNAEPTGLWSDSTTLWVADAQDDKLYAYTLGTWAYDSTKDYSLPGLVSFVDDSLHGVWSDGKQMWVAYQYEDANGFQLGRVAAFTTSNTDSERTLERTFDLNSANKAPRGIWSDGATLWVADQDATRIFAYDLESGRHLPPKDIHAVKVRYERIDDSVPVNTQGIQGARGLHIGHVHSGGPQRWPRSLPSDCFETHTSIVDGEVVNQTPQRPECLRPYGRMMWLVDDDQDKVHAIRLHPALFDPTAAESLTAGSANRSTPPPPKNVRAVTQKSGAVGLTWQSPDGSAVTGYRIERRRADGQGSGPQRSHGQPRDHHTLVEDTGSADTGYTDESAEQGVGYEYRVSARNESGPGEGSDWVRAGPASASNTPATGAPTIKGTAQVGKTLTADITGIADADGLSGETFTYQWVSGDGTTDTDIENATGSTYTLVDADQGWSVKVRVTFTDDGGNEETLTSAPTGPVWGDGLPGAPRNITATPGNREVTLSWEPPADNGNAPAARYRIEWRVDGRDYDQNQWGTSRSTTYTTNDQANLANGVKYFFRVEAENDDGNSYGPYGPASEEVSATPTSGSAADLGTPVLSDTETLHHGILQLDWQDVEDAGWYVAQYYHVKSGEWLDLPALGVDIAFHGSSAVVSNLHGLSWLRVGAVSCAGESEWSQIEQLFGTNASEWEGVPVPEVAEGDEIEPCPVVLGTPVLSDTEYLHHGMAGLDWQDIEDAGWYVVQHYHLEGAEWLDLPAAGVEIAFRGSSAVVSNLHGLSWLRVGAASCDGASEWSQIEQLFGTNASDWEGVPVPEVAEGDEIEPCSEDADTPDNSPSTGAPTITGTVQVGETLTANTSEVTDTDGLSSVQYEYQWLADDADLSGATNATYTLAAEDEGKAIKVEVSFTDDAGNGETLTSAATDAVAPQPTTNSPATGAPTITGTAQVGETLTADTSGIADGDGIANATFSYQWLADDTDITGATGLTYTLTDSEESKAITVQVSFTDDAGNDESLTSAATEAVSAAPTPNSPATGAPTISATAQVGETLTADTADIADADGLSNVQYEYQWLADDAEIAGATSLTYTLADTDEGKVIKVKVSFTDDAGNEETLTSAATDAVATAEPSEPPEKPRRLSATASHDSVTLTWEDPGDDSITGYVILRRLRYDDPSGHFDELVADTGTAAATTYADNTVAADTDYTYRIKAINGAGTSERSRWFHIKTQEVPVPDKPTGLSATASHDSVTLTWDDPGDDAITGYVILRRVRENDTGSDFSVLVADTGTAALTYTDDRVAASTTYTYRIKAINEHGTSERSRWFHIDIPEAP